MDKHLYECIRIVNFWRKMTIIEKCWAVLGLRCCTWAASGCKERGYSSCSAEASRCSGFSCWGTRVLSEGSGAVVHGLRCPLACGASLTRGHTHGPCISMRTLNHCTTREVWKMTILIIILTSSLWKMCDNFSNINVLLY